MYVITNGEYYVYKNVQGKYVTVVNEHYADKFDSKAKANAVLYNHIPKKVRSRLKLEVRLEEVKKETKKIIPTISNCDETELPENIKRWIDKLQCLNGLAAESNIRGIELSEQLSEVDKKITDVLHYCEFMNLNACQGYKLYKILKDLRIERRNIKDELDVINFIQGKKIVDSSEIYSLTNRMTNRSYEPRVLKELFDV